MRKFATLAGLILAGFLLLSGCTANLFMEWDKPEVPSASDMNNKAQDDPDGFIDDVEDYLEGDAVDDDNADDVIKALKKIYDPESGNPPEGETEQQAALLIGEVAIAGDENAGQVVENLAGVVTAIADGTSDDPEDFIKALIPQGLSSQEFADMVESLVAAGEAYLAFGESIGPGATAEDVPFMSDAEIGDTLNRAAAGIAVIAALDALDGTVDGGYNIADIGVLQDVVDGTADFGGIDPTVAFDDATTGYEGAAYLLDLAGFSEE